MRSRAAVEQEAKLSDRVRIASYRSAIRAQVRPGSTVAVVGCGSGLMSLIAAEAGAAHVIAVEDDPDSAALVRGVIADNGLDSIVDVVVGDAATVQLGVLVDVAVCDRLGLFGMDGGLALRFGPFCARHLKPQGVAIPSQLALHLAPVSFDEEATGLWWNDSHGFNLSRCAHHLGPVGARRYRAVREWATLAPAVRLAQFGFGPAGTARTGTGTLAFEVADSALLEGFLGWCEVVLARGVTYTNRAPRLDSSVPLWFWPVAPGVELEAGTRLSVTVDDQGALQESLAWRLDWRAGV